MIALYRRSILANESEHQNTIKEIKMATVRIMFAARQKFRTILLVLFRRYMHQKLLKWRSGAVYFRKRNKAIRTISTKLKTLKMRVVFIRYRKIAKEAIQD
jgi:hypothetical protein